MAKKDRKCFNSVVGITEPEDCIKEKCIAWVIIAGQSGCAFVLEAVTNIINNIKDMEGQDKETANDTDSTNDTQGEEGGTDGSDAGGEEPTASDTDIENAKEQIEGSDISEGGVDVPIASGDATMKPIEEGEYKGDPE